MNIKTALAILFIGPKRKLRALMPALWNLCDELESLSVERNPLQGLVLFLNTTAKWHDRGVLDLIWSFEQTNYKHRHDEVIRKLRRLQLHFVDCGRSDWGLNRTARGEVVTSEKVSLGANIYGLSPQSVSHWMKMREEKRGHSGSSFQDTVGSYELIGLQARALMKVHRDNICSAISALAAEAK